VIRRDYILRMLEEFFEVLSRLRSLKQGQLWKEAAGTLDEQFQKLVGADARAALKLTETELLARLIQGEPTQAVREKTQMLVALLKESGEVAAAEGRQEESGAFYVKALDLILDLLAQGEVSDRPEFVPPVDALVSALGGEALPLTTQVRLMQHYERSGQFAKAEDILFAILESHPHHPGLLEFGTRFYERLQHQSDSSLAAGNLPRTELPAGLQKLMTAVGH
jgi:uncharacterized protein DUF6483